MNLMNSENTKKTTIRKKIKSIILKSTLLSVVVVGTISIVIMLIIRSRSKAYIRENFEHNIEDQVGDISTYIASIIEKYANDVVESVKYAETMYKVPDVFAKRTVSDHMHIGSENTYCFTKYYLNKEYENIDYGGEIELLANITTLWTTKLSSDNGTITSMYLGTESGFFLSVDKYHVNDKINEPTEKIFDYKARHWYEEAKNDGKLVFNDLEQDYFGRGLVLTCSAPIYKDGELMGVLGLDILVDDIQKNIIAVDAGEGSYSFAVDKSGRIIAAPNINKAWNIVESIRDKNKATSVIADDILSGESGIQIVNDNYYIYSPIPVVDWVICVRIPEARINVSLRRFDANIIAMISSYFIFAVIITCIVFMMAESLAYDITEPILKLKNDVDIISKGNLDYKAEKQSDDEIGDLSDAFNDMTLSLKNHINDITALHTEKERAATELNIATKIQVGMLPTKFPAFPNDDRFEIYATMDPAKEVGGDFYDMFKIDENHLAIVIADVSGKGIPAALFMAIGKSLIKDHTYFHNDLSEVFSIVNNILCNSNKEDMFITAFEGVIDLTTGVMKYVNAGHELPFIYREGEKFSPYEIKPCFVLGGIKNVKYPVSEIRLKKGDMLFEYTDGVTEATNGDNELYGMGRLEVDLNDNKTKDVEEILHSIKKDIDTFVGSAPQFDDITMLGFKFK